MWIPYERYDRRWKLSWSEGGKKEKRALPNTSTPVHLTAHRPRSPKPFTRFLPARHYCPSQIGSVSFRFPVAHTRLPPLTEIATTETLRASGSNADRRIAATATGTASRCIRPKELFPSGFFLDHQDSAVKIRHHESKVSLLGGQPFDHSYQPYSGGFREREGYVAGPLERKRTETRMYRPNSKWTWLFIIVTFVQSAIILSFEAYVFAVFQNSLPDGISNDPLENTQSYPKTIPTFLTLFIFGCVYQLVLVWDALRLKNTIQVIGLCMYNVGFLIYAAVQMDQIKEAALTLARYPHENLWNIIRPYLVAIPCVLALGTVLMSFIAWKLYDEFAWTIYKHISADLRMKRRYLTFQIYIALLKFDFFFFLGFTIQFVVVVVDKSDPEFGLTIAAIPVTILILLMAAVWTRRESKVGMSAIIFLYFAAMAYFIFKLVRMYHGPKVPTYIPVRTPLTTFAVITVILIILTIANAIACTMNFNKGLKPHIAKRKMESEDEKAYMTEMPNLVHGPVPSRMTIE